MNRENNFSKLLSAIKGERKEEKQKVWPHFLKTFAA
jgi:hypothetical protein